MRAYLDGLAGLVEHKGSWQLAGHAYAARPYGTQRLLVIAIWGADTYAATWWSYFSDPPLGERFLTAQTVDTQGGGWSTDALRASADLAASERPC